MDLREKPGKVQTFLELMLRFRLIALVKKAGYKPGKDVTIALDCASSEFYKDGKYDFTCSAEVRFAPFLPSFQV